MTFENLPDETLGKRILVDNSILTPNVPGLNHQNLFRMLYDNLEGLSAIDNESLRMVIEWKNELIGFLHRNPFTVIPETLEEVNDGLKTINEQCYWMRTHYKLDEYEEEKMQNLEIIAKQFLTFHKMFGNPKHLREFNCKRYDMFKKAVEEYSKDIKRKHAENALVNRRGTKIGNDLNTDCKIVAAAYTMAYEEDVIVLTRDGDIETLIDRIEENIFELDKGRYYGIWVRPKYRVSSYNPDRQSKELVPASA